MYHVIYSKRFDKSFNTLVKNGLKKNLQEEIKAVIKKLASQEKLEVSYRDHKLHGVYEGYRECHIQGDLLLVYQLYKDELVLLLIDIGTHAELF